MKRIEVAQFGTEQTFFCARPNVARLGLVT